MSDGYLRTRTIPPPFGNNVAFPKAIGVKLTQAGHTAWFPVWMVPNLFYAYLYGTTSDAVSGTGHFEFSDDGLYRCAVGTTLSFSGTGAGTLVPCDGQSQPTSSFSPFTPFKYVRFVCDTISGTGAAMAAFQALGS